MQCSCAVTSRLFPALYKSSQFFGVNVTSALSVCAVSKEPLCQGLQRWVSAEHSPAPGLVSAVSDTQFLCCGTGICSRSLLCRAGVLVGHKVSQQPYLAHLRRYWLELESVPETRYQICSWWLFLILIHMVPAFSSFIVPCFSYSFCSELFLSKG